MSGFGCEADLVIASRDCRFWTQSGHSCLGAIRKGSLPVIGSRGYLLPALKGIGVFGGVLEPSQEVEWLSKFSAVMQTSRYGRQVFHTNSNVPRLLLEDGSAFILR